MRFDAVLVLALGAISYLKFMIQVYDNSFIALGVFVISGLFGTWLGFSFGKSKEDTDVDRSG
ncbi:MAG: hypothetical protein ACRESZ_13900 [Methylococcales bacterium]